MRNYEDLQVWQKAHGRRLRHTEVLKAFQTKNDSGLRVKFEGLALQSTPISPRGVADDLTPKWRDLYRLQWDLVQSFRIIYDSRGI